MRMLLCLGLLLPFAGFGAEIGEGEFRLVPHGSEVALESDGAPLFDILGELERMHGFELDREHLSNRTVRAKFRPLPVDELLARLEISYVLYFSAADSELPEDGQLFTSDLARAIYAQFSEEVRGLIRNLYDDDVRWNASESLWALDDQVTEVLPLLEQTLQSTDYQARQLALFLIQNGVTNPVASPRLLDVAVEALADDSFPYLPSDNPYREVFVANARASYQWFVAHPAMLDSAESRLVQSLYSEDGQLRLLSGVLLVGAGKLAQLPRIMKVLAPHLADNELRGDATLVEEALLAAGPAVLPYLRELSRRAADPQQANMAERIAEILEMPAYTPQPISGRMRSVFWYPEAFPRLEDL